MRYLLLILFFPVSLWAQDANQTMQRLAAKFKRVQSYAVSVRIDPHIAFIRILPVKASIRYRYPDHLDVKSAGISILPKSGISTFGTLFADPNAYTAVASGQEKINGKRVDVINLLPIAGEGDLILAKVWVDTNELLVLKSQLTTRSNGTVLTEFDYGKDAAFGLPAHRRFTVDVKKFKIPKGVATDINRGPAVDDGKQKTNTIDLYFGTYQVN